MWAFGGPHELPADLWYLSFLSNELDPANYDVLTDDDLNTYGAELLNPYDVCITGSHPEYATYEMLDAFAAFLAAGGHFMYLGGSGYCWVTTKPPPPNPHRTEVRRGDQGCRTFGLPPGERHHSMTGELGGLWRSRGRPSNTIYGISSCAMGVVPGVGYGLLPSARSNPVIAFVFAGLDEATTVVGEEGLPLSAASGG